MNLGFLFNFDCGFLGTGRDVKGLLTGSERSLLSFQVGESVYFSLKRFWQFISEKKNSLQRYTTK